MSSTRGRFLARGHLRNLLVVAALVVSRPTAPLLAAGTIVFALGVALRIWSKGILQRDEALSVTGPYALCRHPFYLGNLLADSGICLLAGQPLLLLGYVLVFYAVYLPVMRREEAYLEQQYGEQYAPFKNRLRVFPLPPREWRLLRGPWSFRRAFIKERETTRALRLLAIPLLILWAGEAWRDGWCECVEWEGLCLLCGAALLNLTGHLLYRRVVRPGRRHGLSSGWAPAGLVAVSALLLLMALRAPLAEKNLPRLASQLMAKPVQSARDLPQLDKAPAENLYLVDDDTFHELQRGPSARLTVVRRIWKDFEVYYLARLDKS